MKTLLFLLIPFLSFSQTITQKDTIVSVGETLYLQRYTIISEPVLDTLGLRARINEIDAQISLLNIEKEKKKSLIAAFEELKPLEAMKRTQSKPDQIKKSPSSKPKKKKQ